MAAELATPTDALTGIPLPILQTEQRTYDHILGKPDWHHAWHPERSEVLKGSLSGMALRASRVQLVHYGMHHFDYHRLYLGPKLPEAEEDKFRLIVLSAAGYVPEEALTFDQNGSPKVITMTAEQRMSLWNNKQMKIWNPGKVREFLQDYTFGQDLSHLKQHKIEEFIDTQDDQRRWELGCNIIAQAVHQATEPIKDQYREAYKSEGIPPNRARKASRFVLSSLILRKDRTKLFDKLAQNLVLQVD